MARNQRARLYGAMVEAVARHGYEATTVAHVLALAGVSRRAFYELFSGKEECFLATHDSVVARARKVTLDAWAGERGWANRLHAACNALLEDFATSPKAAHLALVDALGAGRSAQPRIQIAGQIFERMVGQAFASAPDGPGLPRLTSRAIVGGVRHVLFMRLRAGHDVELVALTDEVLDWCEAYRSPLAEQLALSPASRGSGSQRHTPAAFLTTGDERARALGSIVHLTLDEGYEELTDPQLAQFAGISTEAFHKHFATKDEGFLALLDEIAFEAMHSVAERRAGATSWADSVCHAMAAFVEYLVSHEALARMCFVHLFSVGPAIVDQVTKPVDELMRMLAKDRPQPRRAALIAEQAVTGALWGVISTFVLNDHVSQLPRIVEQLTFIVLAPQIGAHAAVEAIQAARTRESEDSGC